MLYQKLLFSALNSSPCVYFSGNFFSNLFMGLIGSREMRILILGLDGAGKTTILYRLQVGEVVTTIPSMYWLAVFLCSCTYLVFIPPHTTSSDSYQFNCQLIRYSIFFNIVLWQQSIYVHWNYSMNGIHPQSCRHVSAQWGLVNKGNQSGQHFSLTHRLLLERGKLRQTSFTGFNESNYSWQSLMLAKTAVIPGEKQTQCMSQFVVLKHWNGSMWSNKNINWIKLCLWVLQCVS